MRSKFTSGPTFLALKEHVRVSISGQATGRGKIEKTGTTEKRSFLPFDMVLGGIGRSRRPWDFSPNRLRIAGTAHGINGSIHSGAGPPHRTAFVLCGRRRSRTMEPVVTTAVDGGLEEKRGQAQNQGECHPQKQKKHGRRKKPRFTEAPPWFRRSAQYDCNIQIVGQSRRRAMRSSEVRGSRSPREFFTTLRHPRLLKSRRAAIAVNSPRVTMGGAAGGLLWRSPQRRSAERSRKPRFLNDRARTLLLDKGHRRY